MSSYNETFQSVLCMREKVIRYLKLSYVYKMAAVKTCFRAVMDVFCALFIGKQEHRF